MHSFAALLTVAGFVVGLLAAWYWWLASRVATSPAWGEAGFEPRDPVMSQMGWIVGMMKAADESAKLNRRAALLTAIAVVLSTGAGLPGLLP